MHVNKIHIFGKQVAGDNLWLATRVNNLASHHSRYFLLAKSDNQEGYYEYVQLHGELLQGKKSYRGKQEDGNIAKLLS